MDLPRGVVVKNALTESGLLWGRVIVLVFFVRLDVEMRQINVVLLFNGRDNQRPQNRGIPRYLRPARGEKVQAQVEALWA